MLGGAALAMFAAVAVVGIQTLGKVDFNDHRNIIVVGTSVGLAMMVTAQPFVAGAFPGWAQIIFGSGITLGALSAIVLSVVFHHLGRGAWVAGRPGADLVTLDQVNAMSGAQFAITFGAVVEGSPWVIERAHAQRPFADTIALRTALLSGSDGEQSELLNSFADLGTECDVAYTAYTRDHEATGMSSLDEETLEDIRELAVALSRTFRLPTDRERPRCGRPLRSDALVRVGTDGELAGGGERAALIEIAGIANYRFDDLVADANPIASARVARYGQLDR